MTPEDRGLEIYEKFGRALGAGLLSEIIRHIREAEEARSNLPYEPYEELVQELLKRSPGTVICALRDAADGKGAKYIVRSHGPLPLRLNLTSYLDVRLTEEARTLNDLGTDKDKGGNYVWEA